MESSEILITILSVTLSVFLLVAIILVVYLIKIAATVRRITDRAEDVASSLSEASRYVRPAVLATAIAKFFRKATAQTRSKRRTSKEEL